MPTDITTLLATRDCSHPNCDREADHHDLCTRHFTSQVARARQTGMSTEQIVRACANGGLAGAIDRAAKARSARTREGELRRLLEDVTGREERARHDSVELEREAREARRLVVALGRERLGIIVELDAITQRERYGG